MCYDWQKGSGTMDKNIKKNEREQLLEKIAEIIKQFPPDRQKEIIEKYTKA